MLGLGSIVEQLVSIGFSPQIIKALRLWPKAVLSIWMRLIIFIGANVLYHLCGSGQKPCLYGHEYS